MHLLRVAVLFAFVVTVQSIAASEAAAQSCGGAGQVPCYHWNSCAFTTPSIFGPVCWGGLVPSTPYGGCNSNRLNNWGLVCVACGGAGQPTCALGPTCNTDQRYTPAGLCYPCGRTGQAACLDAPACDVGNRPVFGFCQYSGFSNEPTTNVASMPALAQPATGPVRGIADLHTHQFANLGFGGVQFWGAPYDARGINAALPWCDYTNEFTTQFAFNGLAGPVLPFLGSEAHGPRDLQVLTHPISNALEEGQHNVGGTGPFDGWPSFQTYTHQQMYYKWVERAYLGGLRLMVVHMVSNEALCLAGKRRSQFSCNDMEAVNRQIQAVKQLEQAIDRLDDNAVNGTGWYRIAYSPAQARQIIRSGRMAIILGIEVDSIFNCKPGSTCDRQYVRNQLQAYYNQGIRHVFPIHQFDNEFGGAAIFKDELNAGNVVVTDAHFAVRNCQPEGYTYNVDGSFAVDFLALLLQGKPFPNQGYYDQFPADCNARGLTPAGQALVEEMMDLKFIIDIDHMSRLMMDAVLDIARTTSEARPNKYPLVSSHTGFQSRQSEKSEFSLTNAQLAVMKEIGGMITANNPRGQCGTSAMFKDGYDFAVNAMKREDGDPFAAVGFSTDMNGFGGSTGPRFDPACAPPTSPALAYPFAGVMGGTFNRQRTGDRVFDFNTQGLAHYGLLADFFADLKRTGMTDAELEPLLNSAESYIRLWEAVDSSDRLPPPEITPQIAGTEGANGWYTSDVALTWEVTGAPGAGDPILTGCEPAAVTTDTAGQTFTCSARNPTNEQASVSVFIRRDATPPTFTANRVGAVGASGWTANDVVVNFSASDNLSGVGGNAAATATVTQEGADQVATATFFDNAGNAVVATLGGINIDRTPPQVGFRFAHLPETATLAETLAEYARWHNGAVTLIVDAYDSLSGVASVTPAQIVFSSEGVSVTGVATATDRAGNSATDSSEPVKIDLTPPVIQLLNRVPGANADGWNNSDITLTWSCADSLSGVTVPEVSLTLSAEGADQHLTGQCADNAQNVRSDTQTGLNLDKTPPIISPTALPAANVAGWNNSDVTVTFNASDALSGVSGASLQQGLVAAEGTNLSVTRSFTDRAGNSASSTYGGINLDKTMPTLTFQPASPGPNANGWNQTPVAFGFTTFDALSGVAGTSTPSPLVVSAEGNGVTRTVSVTDVADNTAAFTSPAVNIDMTAPVMQCAASPGALWPPNGRMIPVAVAMTFTDGLSGVGPFALTTATSNEAGAAQDIAGFTVGQPVLQGTLRARRTGSGSGRIYTLGYRGFDLAGNAATCSTTVNVPHDSSGR